MAPVLGGLGFCVGLQLSAAGVVAAEDGRNFSSEVLGLLQLWGCRRLSLSAVSKLRAWQEPRGMSHLSPGAATPAWGSQGSGG